MKIFMNWWQAGGTLVAVGVLALKVGAEPLLTPDTPIVAFDLDRPGISASDYPSNDSPASGIDGRTDTKYANTAKANSGLIVTLGVPAAVQSFVLTTAADAVAGDPASYIIFGTNDAIVSTENSIGDAENWTQIAEGTLALPAGRRTVGEVNGFFNGTVYKSYKVVFPTLKTPGTAGAMQFSEIQFFPNEDGTGSALLAPGNAVRAIHVPVLASSYPGNESPANGIDGTSGTKYLNFGISNTGFIVTPQTGSKVVRSFLMTTANDSAGRDPATWQLYGTNDVIVSEDNSGGAGENWTLVGEGALALPDARLTDAPVVSFANATAYTSWRMVFPTVKAPASNNSMQFAEIQFFTEADAGGETVLTPGDPILAIQALRSNSGYRTNNEKPSNVIDGLPATKYLNFAERNTGFIVTPAAPSAVQSFLLTTANDAPERDPASYALYGTNDPVVSTDNSNGGGESWTLVSEGLLDLPLTRLTAAPAVSFTNATAYSSWRMIMTSVRDPAAANSMQVAEVQLYPQPNAAGAGVLAPANPIVAVQIGISASSSPGNETPANAFDGNTSTKYLNFGERNTGFIVTPSLGAKVVQSMRLTTANDGPERDPMTWVLSGTNSPILSADHSEGAGEAWTFIAKGRTGLTEARFEEAPVISFSNATAWTSYRLVFPSVRNTTAANSMQIAEVQFFSDAAGEASPVLTPGDPVRGIQLVSSHSDSPDAEEVQFAIDGDTASKYLNFGRERSGVIVTPLQGATTATGFVITTAGDAPERDPANWELYGTNEEVLSGNHGEGDLENWTLISSGLLELPADRGVEGAPVTFTNTTAYTSYRFLVRSVKDPTVANSVQFAEFQLDGTAAAPPAAGFQILNFSATGQPVQNVQLSWGSEPGRSYTVQATTNPTQAGSWINAGNATATTTTTSLTVNLTQIPALSGQPRVVFRVVQMN